MPGLCMSNKLISRDLNTHVQFLSAIFKRLPTRPSTSEATEIIKEVTILEREFLHSKSYHVYEICYMCLTGLSVAALFSTQAIDIDTGRLTQYVEGVGDKVLINLGYPEHFSRDKPGKLSLRKIIL